MVKTSLVRPQAFRLSDRLKSNFFKIAVGWISLVGVSIFCFTVVKKDALEKRKEHLRRKNEITQQIIEEVESAAKKE